MNYKTMLKMYHYFKYTLGINSIYRGYCLADKDGKMYNIQYDWMEYFSVEMMHHFNKRDHNNTLDLFVFFEIKNNNGKPILFPIVKGKKVRRFL